MSRASGWLVAVLTFTVGPAGCTTTKYEVASNRGRPEFHGRVLVYEKQVPSGVDYQVIGSFVEQKQWYGSTSETGSESLRSAASKGANGLLIEKTGHRASGWSWAAPYTEGKLLWIRNYQALVEQPAPSKTTTPASDRLRQLDDLRRQGLLSDAEYETKRKAIIEGL